MSASSLYEIIDTIADVQGIVDRPLTGTMVFGEDDSVIIEPIASEQINGPEDIMKKFNEILEGGEKDERMTLEQAQIISQILEAHTDMLNSEDFEEDEIVDGASLAAFLQKHAGISIGGSQPSMPADVPNPGQTAAVKSGLFAGQPVAPVASNPDPGFSFGGSSTAAPAGNVDHVVTSLSGNLNSQKARVVNFKFKLVDDNGTEQEIAARFAIPAGLTNGLYTGTNFSVPQDSWTPQMTKMHNMNFAMVKAAFDANPGKPAFSYSDGNKLDGYYVQEALGLEGATVTKTYEVPGSNEKPKSATRQDLPAPVPKTAPPAATGSIQFQNSNTAVAPAPTFTGATGGWSARPAKLTEQTGAQVQVINPSNIGGELLKVWQHKNGLRLVALGKVGTVEVAFYLPPITQQQLATGIGHDILIRGKKGVENLADSRNTTLKGNSNYQKITNAAQKDKADEIFNFLRSPQSPLLNNVPDFGYEGPMVQVSYGAPASNPSAVHPALQQFSGNRGVPAGNTTGAAAFNGASFGNTNSNGFQFGGGQQQTQQQIPQQNPNANVFAFGGQQPKNDPFSIPQQSSNANVFGQVQNAVNNAQQQQAPPQQPQQQNNAGFNFGQAPAPQQQMQQQQAPAQQQNNGGLFAQPSGQTLAPAQPQFPQAAPQGANVQNAAAPGAAFGGGFTTFPGM